MKMNRFKENMLDLGTPGFMAKPYGDRHYLIWDELTGDYLRGTTGATQKFASMWEAKRFAEGLVQKGKEALQKILV